MQTDATMLAFIQQHPKIAKELTAFMGRLEAAFAPQPEPKPRVVVELRIKECDDASLPWSRVSTAHIIELTVLVLCPDRDDRWYEIMFVVRRMEDKLYLQKEKHLSNEIDSSALMKIATEAITSLKKRKLIRPLVEPPGSRSDSFSLPRPPKTGH